VDGWILTSGTSGGTYVIVEGIVWASLVVGCDVI
jgi:hypothetical protein